MKNSFRKNPYQKDRDEGYFLHKLRAALLLCCFLLMGTVVFAQQIKYTLVLKNASLTQVMNFVKQKSDYYFLYNDNDIKNTNGININIKNGTIKQLLDQALAGRNISYSIENRTITLHKKKAEPQQKQTKKIVMSGKVIDKTGVPIPGVSVLVKGTQNGVSTDINGTYKISSAIPNQIVVFSFIGMKTQEIPLVNGEKNIVLEEDKKELKEVIVTGYQTISKERATGSFTVVTPNKLKDNLETNILTRLEGRIAGLSSYNGQTSIRGIATLKGNKNPLLIVDGLPFDGKLEGINPAIIQNVTVLKDAAAASIYGARAANGVIVVSTKKGTKDGKVHISYEGGIRFTPTPDFSYLNLLNSKELVDLQKYGIKFSSADYNTLNKRRAINPVEKLLLKNKAGLLSDADLEKELDVYRNLDNRKQIEKFYLRTGILHHHNLSLAGGNAKNRYFASINYKRNNGNIKDSSTENIGFTLRNNVKFFNWLSGDLAISGNFNKTKGDREMNRYFSRVYKFSPSYQMLKDAEGKPITLPIYKSDWELERLKSLGLMDESYSPISNRGEETFLNKEDYFRVKSGLNIKLLKELNLDVMYQTERTAFKNRDLYSENSYYVRSMINDAAQYNKQTNELTMNVPTGGQLKEQRGDYSSYTFRTQLNFLKEWNKHYITAIAGAERRQVKNSFTQNYYMGYDDTSLAYKIVDPKTLQNIWGTEALSGSFNWSATQNNRLFYKEDRYVSFYSNASYMYDKKYGFTGSIRIDQSNLFGTDPKYQYRPLWSLGGSWSIGEEKFMQNVSWADMLKLRITYGIGGNVPKDAGPFLTTTAPSYTTWVDDFFSDIDTPPNPKLRWEKTATTNFGIDFSLFKNSLNGSIDVYRKYTTDLLAYREADPTLGWSNLLLNYGKMENKGIEVMLNSHLKFGDFHWSPSFTFSYNKNEILDVKNKPTSVFDYTKKAIEMTGYAAKSIFSVRYAGLSEQDGSPLYYNGKGEKAAEVTEISDIVYSGTLLPKYTASLNNSFSYKNFNLSFLLIYNGGHVMRGDKVGYLAAAPNTNINRDVLNVWKKPGDEKKPNATPSFTGGHIPIKKRHLWAVTDNNVIKADYIKLRSLALSYTLNKSKIGKLPMESARFTFQVQNLFMWTSNDKDLDPEAMTTYGYGWGRRSLPVPATYTIGVSINF